MPEEKIPSPLMGEPSPFTGELNKGGEEKILNVAKDVLRTMFMNNGGFFVLYGHKEKKCALVDCPSCKEKTEGVVQGGTYYEKFPLNDVFVTIIKSMPMTKEEVLQIVNDIPEEQFNSFKKVTR